MVAIYDRDGQRFVHVSTTMRAEDWNNVQASFLDVTTDMMTGQLSAHGRHALATLMQLLKDMMLNEAQTVKGLDSPAPSNSPRRGEKEK